MLGTKRRGPGEEEACLALGLAVASFISFHSTTHAQTRTQAPPPPSPPSLPRGGDRGGGWLVWVAAAAVAAEQTPEASLPSESSVTGITRHEHLCQDHTNPGTHTAPHLHIHTLQEPLRPLRCLGHPASPPQPQPTHHHLQLWRPSVCPGCCPSRRRTTKSTRTTPPQPPWRVSR